MTVSAKHPVVSLLATALAVLAIWLWPEIKGIVNPDSRDTYSDWVSDRTAPQFVAVCGVHVVVGAGFLVALGHLFDGWWSRRHV